MINEYKRESIRNSDNEVYLSVVSLWETIIKYQLGKLQLPQPPEVYLPTQRERHQIFSLSLDEASVSHLAQLPPIHRDPFDRMLAARAKLEKMPLASLDKAMQSFSIKIVSE